MQKLSITEIWGYTLSMIMVTFLAYYVCGYDLFSCITIGIAYFTIGVVFSIMSALKEDKKIYVHRNTTFPSIPPSFYEGIKDVEEGKTVSMNTALFDEYPSLPKEV